MFMICFVMKLMSCLSSFGEALEREVNTPTNTTTYLPKSAELCIFLYSYTKS